MAALADELQDKGLKPGPFSCHGLAVNEARILYSWDSAFKIHVDVADDALPILDDVTVRADSIIEGRLARQNEGLVGDWDDF